MKLLLVEDDPMIADQIYEDVTSFYPERLTIIGPYNNFDSAVAGLVKEKPSLAVLDIHLKREREAGIRLAEAINQVLPIPFIFLTGLPDRKGFEKAKHTLPVAFLKKPYEKDGLKRALDLTMMHVERNKVATQQTIPAVIKPLGEDGVWVTTSRNEQELLKLNEIIFLKVDDHYIDAHKVQGGTPTMFKSSLRDFYEDYLSAFSNFFHLDRSHVINLKYVTRIKDNHVYLSEEDKFSIPKNRRIDLYKRLGVYPT
ncbi:response regulator transcription factor [Tunicatimonas pelagia]|uniref:response regulator transcription factor n=1 Tax=Tunicatimonas pelagia TaxID=931531 RepID=UPI002666F522|nr:LytTR family transcriptional regulator DNA-binding domain-containing protein [Tunicatimonas pelagia]WKN45261.1 LytTR family transcriptional regulator DNA-binding domain-containing protein [Tunicatimonas pelagia]